MNTWVGLFKLITSYIVLQDDVVMIDRVVDKVNLGCQHMAEVKFQLLCHLERQEAQDKGLKKKSFPNLQPTIILDFGRFELTFLIPTCASCAFLLFSALVSSSSSTCSGAAELILLTELESVSGVKLGENIRKFRQWSNLQGTGEAMIGWEVAENGTEGVEVQEKVGRGEETERLLKEQEVAALHAGENIWNQLKFMAAFEN